MTRLHTASLGMGLIGFGVGVAVSAMGAAHHEDTSETNGDVADGTDGTYEFGLVVGSELWSFRLRRMTPTFSA